MKESKIEISTYVLIFFLLVLIITLGTGCGTSKRIVDNYTEKVDSTFTIFSKTGVTENKDSAKVVKDETFKTDSSTIRIDFEDTHDSDSAAYTDVTIKTDTGGTITINTGGKKIKAITSTKKRIEANKASDSAHLVVSNSTINLDSTNTHVDKKIEEHKVNRVNLQIPWYAYIIFIVFGFLLWFFWNKIITLKKLFNV